MESEAKIGFLKDLGKLKKNIGRLGVVGLLVTEGYLGYQLLESGPQSDQPVFIPSGQSLAISFYCEDGNGVFSRDVVTAQLKAIEVPTAGTVLTVESFSTGSGQRDALTLPMVVHWMPEGFYIDRTDPRGIKYATSGPMSPAKIFLSGSKAQEVMVFSGERININPNNLDEESPIVHGEYDPSICTKG